MPAAESRAFDALLPAGAGQHGRSGGDAPDGRAVSGFTFLWIASDGGGVAPRGLAGEPQAGQTADAGHGAGGDLPEAEHQPEASRSQGIPLSVTGSGHRSAEPGRGAPTSLTFRWPKGS